MEEQKLSARKDGAGSPRAAVEESRTPGAAAQNGERTEEAERVRRRHSSNASSDKTENPGKGVLLTEEPPRKRFQIPRKSREKKALQPISSDSREFEEILRILHASFLEANSKIHFTFQSARLVHNEFLEKEFTEKRRQLKSEGRTDKELAESHAFLLVEDESQVQSICERGLLVGHSRITALGKPSMGVHLSKFADLLQTNPLKPGSKGCIFIFKVIKGKVKIVQDKFRTSQDSSFPGNALLDPAPKHECHTLKNMNLVNSLLCYRAFERSQYYFYEYGFDEILKRPRHVCPYAVVSFVYKADQLRPLSSPLLRPGSVSYSSERHSDRSSFVLWRGQLLCNKKLMCFASLKSSNGPFFPYKLPDKIDLEILMRLEQIKKRIPTLHFFKKNHATSTEVVKSGIYSSLYEVADKTRASNDFQALLHKLEKEQLALVKRMPDRGFLIFYFPTPMTSEYGPQNTKSLPLHALFIYQHSRVTIQPESHLNVQPYFLPENHEIMPEFMTFVGALHYALSKAKLDTSDDFNIVMEKHANLYLKRRAEGTNKHDYILKEYKTFLDANRWLHVRPKESASILPVVTSYLRGSDAYELPVEKAKELIMAHRRLQQFSPISDYEPMEDDFDPEKLHGLLSLIQNVKKNATTNPETDESLSSGVKRRLEDSPETQWKQPRYEDYAHQNRDYAMETTRSVSSLISALGGQDTDLRQENTEESEPSQPELLETEPLEAEPSEPLPPLEGEFCKGLFEKLSSSGLLDSIKKLLPEQNSATNQTLNMDVEASGSAALDSAEYDQSPYVEAQTVDNQESITALGTSLTDDIAVQNTAESVQQPIEELIQGPYSSYASPVPSTPTEEVYQPQDSNSSNEESEFNWKLIPITGEEGRVSEDHVEYLRDENQQGLSLLEGEGVYSTVTDALSNDPRGPNSGKRRSGYSPLEEYQKRRRRSSRNGRTANNGHTARKEHDFLKTKHCQNGAIEKTVLEIYNSFAERLQGVLREKDISYTAVTTPILSSNERDVRLSDWLYAQASSISVEQYVDELRLKLDSVVNSSTRSAEMDKSIKESEVKETSEPLHPVLLQNHVAESAHNSRNFGQTPLHSPASFHNGCVEQRAPSSIQDSPRVGSPVSASDSVPRTSEDATPPHQLMTTSPSSENIAASHTALARLINQMNPEVFTNLVKIFTHVNKNIVKFYIHTSQEDNLICQEIKDYLIKLGNVQCSPEQFVSNRAGSDKLLIIIQNEDIASSIHKIPSLITLKRQPCVSFAGVDSLEDLKNHTYNELFVSGGLIVSDDTVLNPDTITEDALKRFLLFLEDIDSPEGKWQWKIHCKFQKKLKELGRMNKTALNMLTLINTYQKKHLVEILAYHNCDSQNRQAPELDCLIKRQVENIQQRHLIFLTEKNESLFSSHAENGIVVTRMEEFMQNFTNLVGHHNSNEENCLSQLVNQENKPALTEADVKEEEDMSLDSEDEMPPIEVCTTNLKPEPHVDDAMSHLESAEDSQNEALKRTPIVDPEFMQPITPVSTAGSTTGGDSNTASNNYGDYDSRPLAIAPFNLLTHQTFLGSMLYHNQTSGENFFTGSYNQSAEQETFSHSKWDQK
ncbi:LOW QUALITY PROTEIN: protein TASOR [Hyperolius riggenbachi]|uniref:LOW QUALITY PROTEIN: protein TASOR n=1 Tax=Hyperolius riggenbachi TaxID=752182 RepID=UPI0035A3D22D